MGRKISVNRRVEVEQEKKKIIWSVFFHWDALITGAVQVADLARDIGVTPSHFDSVWHSRWGERQLLEIRLAEHFGSN
jgi:hypothetical protein